MKVYVTSDGEYSDYHVTGVFSTREKAVAPMSPPRPEPLPVNGSWEIEPRQERPYGGVGVGMWSGELVGAVDDAARITPGVLIGPLTAYDRRRGGRYHVPRAVVTEMEQFWSGGPVTVRARTMGEFAAIPG